MGRAAFWILCAVVLIAPLALPAAVAQEGSDLVVVGQHAITAVKNNADELATVRESVHYRNTGTAAYDGEIVVDLDPQAVVRQVWFVNDQGAPLDQPDDGPFANESAGDHTRYRIDLAARGVAFEPDRTYSLQLVYTLPGDDRAFTRGFILEHPSLAVTIGQATGLVPQSDQGTFQSQGPSWTFSLDGASQGRSFGAGSSFAFEWVETAVPMTPLTATLRVADEDPLTLEASASGGIAPYAFSWDLDGDGQCGDAEGPSVVVPDDADARVAVCVTDAAQPQGTVRQEMVATTVPQGVVPGSWLFAVVGLLVGALLVFGLVQGGILATGRSGGAVRATSSERSSLAAESKDMLEMRQRVMIAALKELEIAKKKGEVSDGLYTPLKAELKQDTVRVMREIEKRKGETV